MTPTSEQSAILDHLSTSNRNLMIRAYAGCGKTSTLAMIDAATPAQIPILYLCFNRAIANEAEKHMRSTTTVRTLNGLGHRVWSASIGAKSVFTPTKTLDIFKAKSLPLSKGERQEMWREWDLVNQGINLARALGYIPADHPKSAKSLCDIKTIAGMLDETPSDFCLSLIDAVLNESIRQAYSGVIDYGDQTYMPAMFGALYPTFPLVLIDEYQDLSPVNHAMIAKLCRRSRQIGVGDEAQAIYGFRGAARGCMADAITKFDMATLPLSVSFRCPSTIVANVHWRVPDFKASREGGRVRRVFHPDKAAYDNQVPPYIPEDGAAVLCRNNAPLIAMAMRLLISGVSVDLAGIDISSRILKTLANLGPDTLTQTQTLDTLAQWEAQHVTKGSRSARDLAACMRSFIYAGKTLDVALAYAKHLFEQPSGSIHFLSGHKSKGLEWDNVYHLDSNLLSTRGQDPNIHYVIDTRARESLTYIQSEPSHVN